MKKIIILIATILFVIPIAFAQGYQQCPYQQYAYQQGCTIITPPLAPSQPSATVGGGQERFAPFGTPAINKTCKETQQLLDEICYDCEPSTGYLKFNPDDRSVLCIQCATGFLYINKTCIQIQANLTTMQVLSNTVGDIGKNIIPSNPKLGKLLAIVVGLGIIGTSIAFVIEKDKKKKKEEVQKELEDEEDFEI